MRYLVLLLLLSVAAEASMYVCPSPINQWSINGNANTVAGTNYLGTSNSVALAFKTNATERMRIDTSGQVGIGTTSPSSQLYVYSPSSTVKVESETAGSSTNAWFGAKNANQEWLTGLRGDQSDNFVIWQTGTGARMVINTSGNVGIATTAPSNILSIGGTANRVVAMERNTTAATAGRSLTLQSGGAIAGTADLAAGNLILSTGISTGAGTSNILFKTAGGGASGTSDTSPSTVMQITGTGQVGIGTTSPTAFLHLTAGTATAGTAPLKLTSGTNLTAVENGTMEYDGTNFYLSAAGVRNTITLSGGAGGGSSSSTTSMTFNSDSDGAGSDGGFNFQSHASNLMTISNAGDVVMSSATASTSSTTGALKVAGGLGVAGKIFAGTDITAGGVFSAPLGTALLPSYTFTGDPNTGAWSPAADTYSITTGGTEAVRILSSGNVGIGTTAPANILSLGGTAARTFGMDRNTTAATAGQGFTITSGGAIAGTADLNGGDLTLSSGISTGAGSSNISFKTATAGASATTDRTPSVKMTILGNGNVGIGTTSPIQPLHIFSNAASLTTPIALQNADNTLGSAAASMGFRIGTTAGAGQKGAIGFLRTSNNGRGALYFMTNNVADTSDVALTDVHMVIAANGLISMGTLTTPTSLLHLDAGNATASNLQFTAGTTTGQTSTDGIKFGIDASGNGVINQQEALDTIFSTNNAEVLRLKSAGNIVVPTTVTAIGTTGSVTINKISGTVNIAAAAATATVTNSLVSANSIVLGVARTNDATCELKNIVPAAGSFVVNMNTNCTAATSVGFMVIN